MENKKNNLIPNTTQIPNVLLDQWIPLLKDAELRVLLVVARQTLGWMADDKTGNRKERDWISVWQLQKKTGKGERSISAALHVLSDELGIIEATTEAGEVLDTPAKRAGVGTRIFYRLKLRVPQPSLLDTPAKSAAVKRHITRTQKRAQSQYPRKIDAPQKVRTTKETVSTKEIHAKAGKPNQNDFSVKSQEEKPGDIRAKNDTAPKLPTGKLFSSFKRFSEAIRHTTPAFERGKDGNLVKAALRHLSEHQIELLFLWFLDHQKKMATSIGAALCKESIQGFIDATRNEQGFYLRMTDLWMQHNKSKAKPDPYSTAAKLQQLKAALAEKLQV